MTIQPFERRDRLRKDILFNARWLYQLNGINKEELSTIEEIMHKVEVRE